jgi:Reverse transcriptase (RNA-dependent DNA polymerase)
MITTTYSTQAAWLILHLTDIKNSVSLDNAIENFGDESTEILHNKPEKVLQEVASQAAKLFEHNDAPLDINDEWAEFLAPVENADLDTISVADPITLKEIEHALRIFGQDKAPGPSGLTVRHLRRADIATYLVPLFHNAIKFENVAEKWCKSCMIFIPKWDNSYTKRERHLFLEDKSAAFDSITYAHIEIALKHIGVDTKFIKTYMNMLRKRGSRVITAYGLSQPFKYGRGVPQGGVESPLIWNLAYDIGLARLKKENSPFKSVVFAPSAAPKMQELIDNATEIELQLTSFVNDLAMFFNSREDMERGLTLLQEFNKIAGICANPTKSVYCSINCSNPLTAIVNNKAISPANKRTKQRLLGSFFSPALGMLNSLHHATAVLKKSLSILNSKMIGPQCLRYLIKSVICLLGHINSLSHRAASPSLGGYHLQCPQRLKSIYIFRKTSWPHLFFAIALLVLKKWKASSLPNLLVTST